MVAPYTLPARLNGSQRSEQLEGDIVLSRLSDSGTLKSIELRPELPVNCIFGILSHKLEDEICGGSSGVNRGLGLMQRPPAPLVT